MTFSDAVDYALNYLAKDAKESPEAKRAVINAYRTIANKRDWNYYKRFLRLLTSAMFNEGTVQYVASTNTLTLTGSITGVVCGASNASPIQIYSVGHGLQNGMSVTISGVLGNTAANGTFTITVVDQDNFDLDGSTGNGDWTSGGSWSNTAGWPPWVLSGFFRFGLVTYYVTPASLISSTELRFDPATLPNLDFPAGTSYILMQDAYPLPIDFRSIIEINWQAGTYRPAYVDVEEFVNLQTLVTGPSAPYYYTIMGDRQLLGAKDIRFYPAPDEQYPVNVYYNGGPRPLQIAEVVGGTVSCSTSSPTITGSGTAFTQDMVGSVIRLSNLTLAQAKDAQDIVCYPTGLDGLYPAAVEAIIIAVGSATSLTIDGPAGVTLGNVVYKISDPIDVMEGAMMNFFYRSIDMQCRLSMRSKPTGPEDQNSMAVALQEAFEADSVFEGTRVAMTAHHRPRLLREYPIHLQG